MIWGAENDLCLPEPRAATDATVLGITLANFGRFKNYFTFRANKEFAIKPYTDVAIRTLPCEM